MIIETLLVLSLLFGAGAAAVSFSSWARDSLANWLREHHLDRSALMEAVVHLDRVGTAVRSRLFARTKGQITLIKIAETTLTVEQVDDPHVRRRLEKEQLVMKLLG